MYRRYLFPGNTDASRIVGIRFSDARYMYKCRIEVYQVFSAMNGATVASPMVTYHDNKDDGAFAIRTGQILSSASREAILVDVHGPAEAVNAIIGAPYTTAITGFFLDSAPQGELIAWG